ncbi:MAG: hypothetical protein HZB24_08590 [Desulfobacterales bacterium]|nr:hypothetical protein [Desulfobacterales bacterium]
MRTLCADIGEALGCGGHLAELRRTACGGFTLAEAVRLETLREMADAQERNALLVSMETVLRHLPTFQADETVLSRVAHGQLLTPLQVPAASIQGGAQADGPLKVVDAQGRLRAVVERAPDGGTYNYCCVFG